MGIPERASALAAESRVPSPPSTITNSRSCAPISARETDGAPLACTAVSGSTMKSKPCVESQFIKAGMISATSGLLGLETIPMAFLRPGVFPMAEVALYRKHAPLRNLDAFFALFTQTLMFRTRFEAHRVRGSNQNRA